ncbi:MAG: HEAT repeat domain-containing protein [Deltaproteobacteria bacterium]|nr:HEAT repeat domain-containing protein [Deltaproteobacteria bacterium]
MYQLRFIGSMALWLLLCLPACDRKCKPGEDVECWMQALSSPEQREKAIVEIKALGDKKAEPALVEAFKNAADTPKDREEIAEIFGKWKTAQAVKPMMDAIDFTIGPSKDGKKAKMTNRANQKIATALGMIGDKQAVEHLKRLMKLTKDPKVQRSAIRALGRLKATEALDDLLALLADKNEPKIIRANVVYTLGEIGDLRVVPKLVDALYMEKAFFFPHANLALVKIGEPAVDLLVKTMKGENPDVKKLLESSVGIIEGALEANSAQVLGDIGSTKATDALLEMMGKVLKWEAETNRMLVIVRIINSLGEIGDKRAIDPILKVLTAKYWDVRTVVANALMNIGDREVLPQLFKLAETGEQHPRTRVPLVEAIGNLGTDEHLGKLKELQEKIKDRDLSPAIDMAVKRVEAFAACKQNVDCWIGKLKSKEAPIREKAVYELGRLGDKRAVDALVQILNDDDINVRWALANAFSRLNSPKPIEPIDELVETKEKGSTRFKEVNEKYKRVAARLRRTAK